VSVPAYFGALPWTGSNIDVFPGGCSRRRPCPGPLERRTEVGDDVAEHVARHDDVERARVLDHLHRERIDVEVVRLDARVVLRDFRERPLPDVVGVPQGVRLVRHRDLLASVGLRVLERGADDPLDALPRVHVLLDADLVRRPLLEDPAHAGIEPFGVLAEDHEVHVLPVVVPERAEPLGEAAHRAHVRVEVHREARAEQDLRGVLHVRHAGVSERPHEDRVEAGPGRKSALGKRLPRLQEPLGAVIEALKRDAESKHLRCGFEHLDGFRRHVDPDAVAGHHREASIHAASSRRTQRRSAGNVDSIPSLRVRRRNA
jgi:hypothetical protein